MAFVDDRTSERGCGVDKDCNRRTTHGQQHSQKHHRDQTEKYGRPVTSRSNASSG